MWVYMWAMAKKRQTETGELHAMNEPSRQFRGGTKLTARVREENNWQNWGKSEEDGGRRGQCQDPEEK